MMVVRSVFLFFSSIHSVPQWKTDSKMHAGISISCTHKSYYLVTVNMRWPGCLGVISCCEGVKGMCVLVWFLCVCVLYCAWKTFSHTLALWDIGKAGRWLYSGPPRVNIWPQETKFVFVCVRQRIALLLCMSGGSWISRQGGVGGR